MLNLQQNKNSVDNHELGTALFFIVKSKYLLVRVIRYKKYLQIFYLKRCKL